MTYAELRTILRRDLLAEASTDYWSDDDLLGFLKRAAMEVAHELSFPITTTTVAVNAGDVTFNIPSDAADAQVNDVSYGGFRLVLAPRAVVTEYQALDTLNFPRYYNVDPKQDPAVVRFAPPAPDAGSMMVDYVLEYDNTEDGANDEPWDGLFRRYHELVAYRAAVKAFESSLEEERAAYMQQRSNQLFQSFALFLGKRSIVDMIGAAQGGEAA